MRWLSSRTSVCCVTESVCKSYNSSTTAATTDGCSRADRDTNCHELFREVCLSPLYPSETCVPAVLLKSLSCSQHSELLVSLQHHLFPCSSKRSPSSTFPLARCVTCVVFLLLRQLSSKFETEAKVILTLLIKLICGKTEAGEPRLVWMRVLVMESIRRYSSPVYFGNWLTGDHGIFVQASYRYRVHAQCLPALRCFGNRQ